MSENRALRREFEPKRRNVRVGWIKLRNDELHDMYFSTRKKIVWVGHVESM
jgi:hypothetical protein